MASFTRRQFLHSITVYGTALSVSPLLNCISSPKKKPNILIIYADDLGYGDLSCYGGDIPTPNIDSIADDGIRFTQFYVSSPACTPSRYTLLTGSFSQRSRGGLNDVYMPGDEMHFHPGEKTLAEMLQSAGYHTAIFGKWHLGNVKKEYFPKHHGFDKFCGLSGGCIDYFQHCYGHLGHDWYVDNQPKKEDGYATELIANHAVEHVKNQPNRDNPFFIFLSFTAPHYGKTKADDIPPNTLSLKQVTYQGGEVINSLQAPQEYLDRFSQVVDEYRRYYSAMVSCLDDQVGRVLQQLKDSGLDDDTMIWFISDNGGYSESYYKHADNGGLKGEKATVYEGGIRVPAMLRWKGRIKPGQTKNDALATMDIVPTLANVIGFKEQLQGLPIDGYDITDVLLNKTKGEPRTFIWEWADKFAVRKGKWKLVHETELYDIENDMYETTDLSDQHPEKVAELKKLLQHMKASTKPNASGAI